MRARTFPHGIYPPEHKSLTGEKPLELMPPPEKVFIPLLQHFGKQAEALVKKGDEVFLGQNIGKGSGPFSASVHSSVSGKILSVEDYPHPLGKPVPSITIANDGKDSPYPENPKSGDPFSLSPKQIRKRVKDAGIVGLGGAAFPTAVKLAPPKDKPIDTIIINGCECEPILTGDYRLMLEYPDDILNGAELIRMATGAKEVLIGIEKNKMEALRLFQKCQAGRSSKTVLLKTKYPQGAEKNLIYALLRREVPCGGLPFDVGVIVQNVGTAKAIWDAVKHGKPLYERALTVSGSGICEPKNLIVRIGTPFQAVVDFCGGIAETANLLIMGGPMMGISQGAAAVPVIKGTSGIVVLSASPPKEMPCIGCGRCVDSCPMELVPALLAKYVKSELFIEAEQWGILDCVECGCCQYSCPAKIPLVHWIRLGKSVVLDSKRKQNT